MHKMETIDNTHHEIESVKMKEVPLVPSAASGSCISFGRTKTTGVVLLPKLKTSRML